MTEKEGRYGGGTLWERDDVGLGEEPEKDDDRVRFGTGTSS